MKPTKPNPPLSMIPMGYLAKRITKKSDWLDVPTVVDIYSLSNCMSEDFCDYVKFWKHNGAIENSEPGPYRIVAVYDIE